MKSQFLLQVNKPEQTMLCGEIMGKFIPRGSIVGLTGELGAGKTVFAKGLAFGLGIEEEPNSPTFVIMNCYEGRVPFFHFDVYRLSGGAEFENTGYEEFFYGDGVCVVEWADKIQDVLPANAVIIDIQSQPQETGESRTIKVTGEGKWLSSFRNMVEQALLASTK